MSKIQFEQITKDEVEINFPPETPMEIVEQIRKSLISKGLIEDLVKSTISTRYFHRNNNEIYKLADKLIKSLETMAKDINNPYSKEARRAMSERNRVNDRRSKVGMPSLTDSQIAAKNPAAPAAPGAPIASKTPNTLSNKPSTLFDPNMSGKINYKKSEEHDDDNENCACEKCQMNKSGTGPKGTAAGAQYIPEANARRKANNTGDVAGQGPNVNVKAFSSKPGQLSAKQEADRLASKQKALNRKQPVRTMKDMTPEELADITAKNLKKSWANHPPFPHAEQEMEKLKNTNPVEKAENLMANQLANLMNGKAMLGQNNRQPTSEDFIMAGEQMGMGTSEQVAKSQDNQWNNTINNWLNEAVKPISQRFASEEEEQAYWNSIKVGDRDNGQSGY